MRRRRARPVVLHWPGRDAALAHAFDPPEPAQPGLEERYGGEGAADHFILGDNLDLLRRLLHDAPWRRAIAAQEPLRFIYIDPPFLAETDFYAEVPLRTPQGPDAVLLPAYCDRWSDGLASYLDALLPRLMLMRELLADDGLLCVHCDWRANSAIRMLLDEVFGPERYVNEIIWRYGLGNARTRNAFLRKHDTLLLYAKSPRYTFNVQRGEVTPAMRSKYRHRDEGGHFMRSYGRKYYLKGGKPLDCVWEIPALSATDSRRSGYPTQKPAALLERLLAACTNPGDLTADFYAGSGTLGVAARRSGRRALLCDSSPTALNAARQRLATTEGPPLRNLTVNETDADRLPDPRVTVAVEGGSVRLVDVQMNEPPRSLGKLKRGGAEVELREGRLTVAADGGWESIGDWRMWLSAWGVGSEAKSAQVYRSAAVVFRPADGGPIADEIATDGSIDPKRLRVFLCDVLGRRAVVTPVVR